VLGGLEERGFHNSLLARARRVYEVYANRSDALASVRSLIPPGEGIIGVVSYGDDPVASLWKPIGHRRVICILPHDSAESLRQQGVHYIAINAAGAQTLLGTDAETWAAHFGCRIVDQTTVDVRAHGSPSLWLVAKLD
jgi:hypothetical protein